MTQDENKKIIDYIYKQLIDFGYYERMPYLPNELYSNEMIDLYLPIVCNHSITSSGEYYSLIRNEDKDLVDFLEQNFDLIIVGIKERLPRIWMDTKIFYYEAMMTLKFMTLMKLKGVV